MNFNKKKTEYCNHQLQSQDVSFYKHYHLHLNSQNLDFYSRKILIFQNNHQHLIMKHQMLNVQRNAYKITVNIDFKKTGEFLTFKQISGNT